MTINSFLEYTRTQLLFYCGYYINNNQPHEMYKIRFLGNLLEMTSTHSKQAKQPWKNVGHKTHWSNFFFSFILKWRFLKNRERHWSNLPQNSNFGRELVQKSEVQILVRKVKSFCPVFLSFSYSPKKLNIDTQNTLFFLLLPIKYQ